MTRGFQKSDIGAAQVMLKVSGDMVLFVLLAADGTVNRMGNGYPDDPDKDLFIGRASDPLFTQFMNAIPQGALVPGRTYTLPGEHRGLECELLIQFLTHDGQTLGVGFTYGTESDGPPADVQNLVIRAVELTNPWHREQKTLSAKARGSSASGPS